MNINNQVDLIFRSSNLLSNKFILSQDTCGNQISCITASWMRIELREKRLQLLQAKGKFETKQSSIYFNLNQFDRI